MAKQDKSTLFIRHLPASLSLDERQDLLQFFGAKAVNCMSDSGAMKYAAFATFDSPAAAHHAIRELHQLEILGSRLSAEISKHDRYEPSELDRTGAEQKPDVTKPKPELETKVDEPVVPADIDGLAPAHKVTYSINPRLLYVYPPPTVEILTNIANALASVPKFYVQVLHLMNKMNLPAPFGATTQTPPNVTEPVGGAPDIEECEMEVPSSEESEIESDEGPLVADLPVKRAARTRKPIIKRSKLQKIISAPRSAPALRRDQVFEKATKEKRIVKKPTAPLASASAPADDDIPMTDVRKYVTLRELQRNRLSSRKMKRLELFRDYQRGARNASLLVTNLHKDIPEAMITFIFGRYINWGSEAESAEYSVCLNREQASCTVTLPSVDVAELACEETNGYKLMGEYMVVRFLPMPDEPPTEEPMPPSAAADALVSTSERLDRPGTPVLLDRASTPERLDRASTPECLDRVSTPEHLDRPRTPVLLDRATTPELLDRASTPELLERAPTPDRSSAPTRQILDAPSRVEEEESFVGRIKSPQFVSEDPKYISTAELEAGRISGEEMAEIKVFKNYAPGECTNRLYVKNLNHKRVEESDVVRLFGKFVRDQSGLEIKLMKEGRMKGQAFVIFPSPSEAQTALSAVNGFVLYEKPMVVQFGRSAS